MHENTGAVHKKTQIVRLLQINKVRSETGFIMPLKMKDADAKIYRSKSSQLVCVHGNKNLEEEVTSGG